MSPAGRFLLTLTVLLSHSTGAHAEKLKLVVDTDGVSDDVRALTMALQQPRVQILAITTISGSTTTEQAVANVARTLRANRAKAEIPICKGPEETLIGNINTTAEVTMFFGQDGISDQPNALPKAEEADKHAYVKGLHAAEALVSLFKEHKHDAILVATGPLTNLALALELNPDFASWPKRLVLTGGNIYGMGNIQTASTAEYNFNADPEAASIVLERMKCPITVVAWETTFFYQDLFNIKFDFERHLNLNYPLARYLKAATSQPRQVMARFKRAYRFCDEITMAVAIDPEIITRSKNVSVAVELHGEMTRGQMVVGWLEEWVGKSLTIPMNKVQLVLDYDVHKLDKMLVDAIKQVPARRRDPQTAADDDNSTTDRNFEMSNK